MRFSKRRFKIILHYITLFYNIIAHQLVAQLGVDEVLEEEVQPHLPPRHH